MAAKRRKAGDSQAPSLAEWVRTVIGPVIAIGGLAMISLLAWYRSLDEAERYAGIVAALIGGVLGYYFGTKGVDTAQKAASTASELRDEALTINSVQGDVTANMKEKILELQNNLEAAAERYDESLRQERLRTQTLEQKLQDLLRAIGEAQT